MSAARRSTGEIFAHTPFPQFSESLRRNHCSRPSSTEGVSHFPK